MVILERPFIYEYVIVCNSMLMFEKYKKVNEYVWLQRIYALREHILGGIDSKQLSGSLNDI